MPTLFGYPYSIVGSEYTRAIGWVCQASSATPLSLVPASRPTVRCDFPDPTASPRGSRCWNLGRSPTRSALRHGSLARQWSGFHNRKRGSTRGSDSF